VAEIDFGVVLISPLRRTIESAYHMFKQHPDFDQIKFVLMPTARENLTAAGGIPIDTSEVLEQFSYLFP
jgi:hypothetical protein